MARNWTESELAEIIKRHGALKVRLCSNKASNGKNPSKRPSRKYQNEKKLQEVVRAAGLAVPLLEYKFLTARKFKFDLCWPDRHLACEVDGMAHRIKARFLADMEKMNLAREAGWLVIHCTPSMIGDGRALGLIRRALDVSLPAVEPISSTR